MEQAKLVVIEDYEQIREIIKKHVEHTGHQVVAEAGNLADALSLIDRIKNNELEADAVILDGNLSAHEVEGHDAITIAKAMKEAGITAKIIGFSARPMRIYGIEVDADPGKNGIDNLLKAINEL